MDEVEFEDLLLENFEEIGQNEEIFIDFYKLYTINTSHNNVFYK